MSRYAPVGRYAPRATRFWDFVEITETCWLWNGTRARSGHGRFSINAVPYPAHRFAYEVTVGPIPDGLVIDHLCCNPPCVNPDHLEAVPQLVNAQRYFSQLTHCKNGHEFTPENTFIRREGWRACRQCHRNSEKIRRDRRRATNA